ncbi:Protein tyrosine phosphatase domain-containing protein 1 [Sparganum proliferum]
MLPHAVTNIIMITDEILATARPSTEIIRKKNLISVFKQLQIKTIINMQIPGEHPYCGDGINKSGFSYDPEVFMEAGSRPGSVQSTIQLGRIKQFAAFTQSLRGIYLEGNSTDLSTYLQRQYLRLRGIETKNFENLPKIVYVCFRLLLKMAYPPSSSKEIHEVLPCDPEDPLCDGVLEDHCKDLQSDDESRTPYFLSPKLVIPLSKGRFGWNILLFLLLVRQTPARKKAVLEAFLNLTSSEEVLNVVEMWKARLNANDSLWKHMCKEIRNPLTLVKLLYDWFSTLRVPAVREEDVPNLCCSCQQEVDNDFFKDLSKPVGTLLKTCSRFVFYLRLRNFQDEAAIIDRLVGMVTQEPNCGPSPRVDGSHPQAVWRRKLSHILHHAVQSMGDT